MPTLCPWPYPQWVTGSFKRCDDLTFSSLDSSSGTHTHTSISSLMPSPVSLLLSCEFLPLGPRFPPWCRGRHTHIRTLAPALHSSSVLFPWSSLYPVTQARNPQTLHLFSLSAFTYILYAKLLQSCLTLCDPMDHRLPGSSVWESPGHCAPYLLSYMSWGVLLDFSPCWFVLCSGLCSPQVPKL